MNRQRPIPPALFGEGEVGDAAELTEDEALDLLRRELGAVEVTDEELTSFGGRP